MAYGVPAGLGDPMFDGIENRIARIAFGIPAVKGVEFGVGFGAAELRGSENNDAYRVEDGRVCPQSNSAGASSAASPPACPWYGAWPSSPRRPSGDTNPASTSTIWRMPTLWCAGATILASSRARPGG